MPDFSGTAPGIPSIAERSGISDGAVSPAVRGAIRDAGGPPAGRPPVDPNQWGNDLIAALNRQERDLQLISSNLATGTAMTNMGGTGYSLSAAGTAGDTVAVALATTKMQAQGGSMVDVGMKAASKALEVQKKIS